MTRKNALALITTLALALGSLYSPFVSTVDAQQKGQTLQDLFNESVAHYKAGRYLEASAGFQQVLRQRPNYVYARQYLAKCQAELRNNNSPKRGNLEGQLARISIPKVKFEQTPLEHVLLYLSQKSTELSNNQVTANFIYRGDQADVRTKFVTLDLANLPITEVIRYVGLQTGTRFTYDTYAVVCTPTSAVEASDTNKIDEAERAIRNSKNPFLEENKPKPKGFDPVFN